MATKPELSEAGREVLEKLADGWQIGRSSRGRTWMQRHGVGNGGDSQNIHGNVFAALMAREFIKHTGGTWPNYKFDITPAGREAIR